MLDLYTFNDGGIFQKNSILESELKKCKTEEERDQLIVKYQVTLLISLVVIFLVAILICGVLSLIRYLIN